MLVEQEPGVVATYTWGNELVAQTRTGSGTRFPLVDGQLSVRQLTTSAGTVSDTYDYDAFGVLLASSGSTPNAYRYAGEPLDPNVGFYYLRARWYDHATGRFTSTDPQQGNVFDPVSLHRYLYANANPVDNRDPSGEITLANAVVTIALQAIVIGILSIPFTRSLRRSAEIARDQFFFGLVVALVLFAIPVVFAAAEGLGIAAGTGGAAVAGGVVEGRAALRIVRGLVEFVGEDTLQAVLSRGVAVAREGGQIFEFLPAPLKKELLAASPRVLAGTRQFVQSLKALSEIPGTGIVFRNPKLLADFKKFFDLVLASIPK